MGTRYQSLLVPVATLPFLLAEVACGGAPATPTSTTVPPTPATALVRIALRHLTVVNVANGTEQPDQTVIIEGDRIVSVVAGPPPASPAVRSIDMHGKYAIPSLWDMHVHFYDPSNAKLFVANGVPGVRVMWGNPPFLGSGAARFHFEMRDAIDRGEEIGTRMSIASQVLDGPKPIWPGSVALATAEEGRKAVDDAKKSGVDFIKVYSLLPRDVYFAIADQSKKDGLPFEGHLPEAIGAAEASDAGQKSFEHLNGMFVATSSRETELRKRQFEFAKKERSPAEWAKFTKTRTADAMASYEPAHARALFSKFAVNGTWQCPTLTVNHSLSHFDDPTLANDPRLEYVSPFTKQMWSPREDFLAKDRTAEDYVALRVQFEKQLALVAEMSKGGVPILAGTDEINPYCFAGFSLHDELGWLVKAGLSPVEALRAATTAPAKFFGKEATMGSVAEGKIADFVVLDADPLADIGNTRKIATVVSRGKVYDRVALDKMLADVKAAAASPPH